MGEIVRQKETANMIKKSDRDTRRKIETETNTQKRERGSGIKKNWRDRARQKKKERTQDIKVTESKEIPHSKITYCLIYACLIIVVVKKKQKKTFKH